MGNDNRTAEQRIERVIETDYEKAYQLCETLNMRRCGCRHDRDAPCDAISDMIEDEITAEDEQARIDAEIEVAALDGM